MIRSFKNSLPFFLIFAFQSFNSLYSFVFEFDNINLWPYLSKLFALPICLIGFYGLHSRVKKNNLILNELILRMYSIVGSIVVVVYILHTRFNISLFNFAAERSESLVRIATPLGNGFTVFGSSACLFAILLYCLRSTNIYYWMIAFLMLLLSAQRSSYVFIFIFFFKFITERISLTKHDLKNAVLALTLFLLITLAAITVYPPFLLALQSIFSSTWNELTGADQYEYNSFSNSLVLGDGGYLWRLYEYGSHLFSSCWDSRHVNFLLFGCGGLFLGPEYGYLLGDQSHSTIWSLFFRLGLFPFILLVYYSFIFYFREFNLRLAFPWLCLFLLASSSGGLLVNPACILLLITILYNFKVNHTLESTAYHHNKN